MRALMLVVALVLTRASGAEEKQLPPCPRLLAVLPTSMELLVDKAIDMPETRERFELRECGGFLQVHAFQKDATSPTLRVDAGDNYPPYLFHMSNVLAFQSMGGASDHVYVFAFEKGKPRLVLQMSTKDKMSVSLDQTHRTVTILIPRTTYPSPDGPVPKVAPKRIVLRLGS